MHQTMIGFGADVKVIIVAKPFTKVETAKELLTNLVNELNEVYGERAIFTVIKGVE